jgi:UDP-glucose 4-epimerase
VHVDDVVQALLLAAEKPEAAGQTYIVTDGRVYSTRGIYRLICAALGRSAPRWAVPIGLLKLLAAVGDLIGKVKGRAFVFNSMTLEKLIGSAWYSSAKIALELGYQPTRSLEDSLPEMIVEYRNSLSPEQLGARSHPR